MDLNSLQVEGILYLILVIPIIIAFIIVLRHLIQHESRHAFFFMLAWLCYVIWGIANGFLLLLNASFFAFLGAYITIPLAYFAVLFFDSISREGVSLVKMLIITVLSTVKCVLLMLPGAIQSSPYPGGLLKLGLNSPLLIVGAILIFTLGVWYVYFNACIYRNAPGRMRRYSIMNLWGAIAMGLVGPFVALFSVNPLITLSVGIGMIFTSIAFTRMPHLAYILPFRVYRLTVLDNCSGLQLFTNDWNVASTLFNPDLFSGMLHGLSGILNETLQKGFPREIHLEHAVVLFERIEGLPLTFVLIASKTSQFLRRSLYLFSNSFAQLFGGSLSPHRSIIKTDFSPAKSLVNSTFPFIPNYIEKEEKNEKKL